MRGMMASMLFRMSLEVMFSVCKYDFTGISKISVIADISLAHILSLVSIDSLLFRVILMLLICAFAVTLLPSSVFSCFGLFPARIIF